MKGTILLRLTVHSLVKTTELTTIGSLISTGKSLRSTNPSWPLCSEMADAARFAERVKYSPLPTVDFQAYRYGSGPSPSPRSRFEFRFVGPREVYFSTSTSISCRTNSRLVPILFALVQIPIHASRATTSLLCLVAGCSPLLIHQSLVSYFMSYPKRTSSVPLAVSDNKWGEEGQSSS